jgi:hypothetical protein
MLFLKTFKKTTPPPLRNSSHDTCRNHSSKDISLSICGISSVAPPENHSSKNGPAPDLRDPILLLLQLFPDPKSAQICVLISETLTGQVCENFFFAFSINNQLPF